MDQYRLSDPRSPRFIIIAGRSRVDSTLWSRCARALEGELPEQPVDVILGTDVDADGRTVSHEAIYRWIYALPKGELAKSAILLRSNANPT